MKMGFVSDSCLDGAFCLAFSPASRGYHSLEADRSHVSWPSSESHFAHALEPLNSCFPAMGAMCYG
jgi:hypothetical protein